jgi:DNA modification methylase
VRCGFELRSQLIWAKNNIVISRGHYHYKHEPCWYAVRKGTSGHWNGDRNQASVWQIDKPMKSDTGHSAQKPVECMLRPIENNSSPGQAVYHPFLRLGYDDDRRRTDGTGLRRRSRQIAGRHL